MVLWKRKSGYRSLKNNKEIKFRLILEMWKGRDGQELLTNLGIAGGHTNKLWMVRGNLNKLPLKYSPTQIRKDVKTKPLL